MNVLFILLLQCLFEWLVLFVLFYCLESNGLGLFDVICGEVFELYGLVDLLLDEFGLGLLCYDLLVLIFYWQIVECGFEVFDDGMLLLVLKVLEQELLLLEQVLVLLLNQVLELSEEVFDFDDEVYVEVVGWVIVDEIGCGEGVNFVIKWCFQVCIDGYVMVSVLSFFCQLLLCEKGVYWIFIVYIGECILVGVLFE